MHCRKRRRATASALAAGLAIALGAGAGCTIQHYYIGSKLPTEGMDGTIHVGVTTKAQVLAQLGAPDELRRQFDGDVFVYRYMRMNSSQIKIEEPIRSTDLYVYKRVDEKSDRVVVLFDRAGLVSGVGVRMGTPELDADAER
jgi:outer membrane protein assembly factor BamE (lipoprotein component of BamABCDE complex)